MNLQNKKLLVPIIVGSFLLFLGNASNPPDGNTGAPFDGLCSSCHGGGSYAGTVDLTGFPSSITPNTAYPITITTTATSGSPLVGGFQLVAVDGSNVNSGDLAAGSGSGTSFFNGREYLDHRGAKAYSGNSISWNFNWTSPGGPAGTIITMYFSSNMANGNGSTSGDKIIKSSKSGTISGGIPLSINITSKKNVSCFGGADGTATASAGGGVPPYTYLWSNGKTGNMITMLTAATYKVTVTDATTATASTSAIITQPVVLNNQLNVVKNVSCPGGKDGSILATASGGTSPYSYVYSSGSPNNLQAGFYTSTVTDANSCTAISSVVVTQPDSFTITTTILKNPTCPLDSNGQLKISVSGANPPYTYLWSSSETSNEIINKKTGNYKVTVTDVKNCTVIRLYQLKSGDTIAPNLVAKNSKVYLDSTGKVVPKISDYIVTNTDNCDTLPVLTINIDTFRCSKVGKGNYIISSTDASGNKTKDTIEIEVFDTLKPKITCPINLTISCEKSTDTTNTGIAIATDNCMDTIKNISHVDIKTTGNCNDNFSISRTWTAIDSSKNSQTCVQFISVQDTTKPAIICPLNKTINCEASSTPANTGIATATDNCTNVVTNISYSDVRTNGSCNDNYVLSRTWTAVDSCGNSKTCAQFITVQDTTKPVITCPVNKTINCEASSAPANTGTASAFDNCTNLVSNISYSDIPTNGSCNDNYSLTRRWQAIDSCSNSKFCFQIIMVQDTTKPIITCPANKTINCESNIIPSSTGTATATDNCTNVVTNINFNDIRTNGNCTDNYSLKRNWIAIDSCGNSRTCFQVITVQDTTRPVITCYTNVTINCESSNLPANTGTATATDNCTNIVNNISFSDLRINGSCNDNYYLKRTWLAVDSCGNSNTCLQVITIQDTTRPVIFCPTNKTINCEASNSPANTGTATAVDNCTNVITNISYSDLRMNGSCYDNFILTRSWIVVDSCDNSKNCIQFITIQDSTKPAIICPSNKTINCSSSSAPANTGTASAIDNCTDEVTNISFSDVRINGSCNDNYTLNRIWTAADSCGNSVTCTQTITIQDTTRPKVFCPEDLTLNCETSSFLPARTGTAVASDNCTNLVTNFNYTDVRVNGSCNDNYTLIRTWTGVDSCGNANTCLQRINVQDTTKPNIICPVNITINCELSTNVSQTGIAIATDNCTNNVTNIEYSDTLVAGIKNINYKIIRTWTATDSCNNANKCVQTITALDTSKPVIQIWKDTTFRRCDVVVPLIIATDNCALLEFKKITGPDVGTVFKTGVTILVYTAKDVSGNVAIDSFTTTIRSPLQYTIDSLYFNNCKGDTAFTIVSLHHDLHLPMKLYLQNDSTKIIKDSSLTIKTSQPDTLNFLLTEESTCTLEYKKEIAYPGILFKLDSVKITDANELAGGKIEIFIKGPADSIVWYDANTDTVVNKTGLNLNAGDYIVKAYKDSCKYIYGPYKINKIVSLVDLEKFNLSVYPIPFSNELSIVSDNYSNLKYALLNAQGNIVNRGEFNSKLTLNTSQMSVGIYFLRCLGVKNSCTIKLIKY